MNIIYGLCVTKDEEDIIEFNLTHAAKYCKNIFVLDNGSSDTTWKIVNDLSKKNPAIIPLESKKCQYADGLKGYVFNKVRHIFKEQDWILILDSDEFLEEDPQSYIDFCKKNGYEYIKSIRYEFYITKLDMDKNWFKNSINISSFHELPCHYRVWLPERRLFKYKSFLIWPDFDSNNNPIQRNFPIGVKKKLNFKIIGMRHYRYRSYEQIKKRLKIRSEVYKETGCFIHNRNNNIERIFKYANNNKLKFAFPDEKILYLSFFKYYLGFISFIPLPFKVKVKLLKWTGFK